MEQDRRIFRNWFQVTLIEVTSEKEVRLMVEVQSSRWRWNIGITQVLQLSLLIRQRQTTTKKDRQWQTMTNKDRQRQTKTDKERQKQLKADMEHWDYSDLCLSIPFMPLNQCWLSGHPDFLCPSGGAASEDVWQHRLRKKESVHVRFPFSPFWVTKYPVVNLNQDEFNRCTRRGNK